MVLVIAYHYGSYLHAVDTAAASMPGKPQIGMLKSKDVSALIHACLPAYLPAVTADPKFDQHQ